MVIIYQLLRYALSGLLLNTLGFLFYIIMLKFFNLSPIISVSISYPAIMTIYLFSQSLYVFRKKLSIRILNKFLLNILLFYLLNILLLSIFLEMLNFNPIIAQLFIMVFFIIFNFFFQKKFVFK
jgi:putative flippase GtrA